MPAYNQIDQTEAVNRLFADYSDSHPGASVLICKDGKIVFSKSFGYANLEEKKSVETKTNFRLASVTKQFTSTAILILVQNGQLNLETNLSDIFKNFPSYGKKITIRHLLNQVVDDLTVSRQTAGCFDRHLELHDPQAEFRIAFQFIQRPTFNLLHTLASEVA